MQLRTVLFFLLFLFVGTVLGQTKTLVFKFKANDDGFIASHGTNRAQLEDLFTYIQVYKSEILGGKLPIDLTGYCDASQGSNRSADLRLASIRAGRVKAEMISRQGLNETCFNTHALSYPYQGQSDVVVVKLTIPAKTLGEESKPEVPEAPEAPTVPEAPKKETESNTRLPESLPETYTPPCLPLAESPATTNTYNFGFSSNLLYLLALTPNLGLEWKPSPNMGILLNGAFSKWDFDNNSKHHRLWMFSPELRCYFGENTNLYFGGMFLLGEFNIKFSDTGYQGDYSGGGAVLGYQLALSTTFNLDFGLGLGFVRANYDSYVYENGVNVVRSSKLIRDYWGPTKAGITLIWKLD